MSDILEEVKERSGIAETVQKTEVSPETSAPAEPVPVLEYVEVKEPAAPSPPLRKRKRGRGVAVLAALAVFAGLGFAAYRFGVLDSVRFDGLPMENITDTPEGAEIPEFIPIDPLEFFSATGDELIAVPDETGLALPSADGEQPVESPAPQNHYAQIPNVSKFYTRAAQDESYVYFLEYPASNGTLSDIMRMRISDGKTGPVSNANEAGGSIYSFALFGQNIITCEFNSKNNTYAFYRVPKSGGDAQLLFEEDSPAIINVYDNKLFMLFAASQRLGVFDPESDTLPAYIAMELAEDGAAYLPEFSVVNGYLYYGVSYDGTARAKYFRRSLYTGAVTGLLDSGGDGVQILNPCWDGDGNAYYGQYEPETDVYNLAVSGAGGSREILNTFALNGDVPPLIALKDEFLLAAASYEDLCKYRLDGFLVGLEVPAQELPFAVTKDFLITSGGVYRIFDFDFIAFDR